MAVVSKTCVLVLFVSFFLDIPALAAGDANARTPVPLYCNNVLGRVPDSVLTVMRREDNELRQLFIRQALGDGGLNQIASLLGGVNPFDKVQSKKDALKLVDRAFDDPNFYEPILRILNSMSNAQSWALYLNSGYYAISTHTDGHRAMVQQSADLLPSGSGPGGPIATVDYGMGAGNMALATAVADPSRIVHGIDIAGAGIDISTFRLNRLSDWVSQTYNDPGFTRYGRFSIGRRSITDTQLLPNQQFDAATMMLTLFTVPEPQRLQALQNVFASLKPGATFVLIDPAAMAHDPANGRKFLRTIVEEAWRNNPDLTNLDVAILAVKNAQALLKTSTQFYEPSQLRKLAEQAGFRLRSSSSAYYGCATMLVLEKPE